MDQQWREKDGEVGTPAMEPDITNRVEEADPVASNATGEKGDSNPFGWATLEGVVMKTQGELLNIGTWNVRTLYQPAKLDNLIQELNHMKIDVIGMAGTRWTDTEKIVER